MFASISTSPGLPLCSGALFPVPPREFSAAGSCSGPRTAAAGALDPELDPTAALDLARRAAWGALRRSGAAGSADAAGDVAADALVVLLERSIPLAPRSIFAAVKHLARKHAARVRVSAPLDPERLPSGVDPAAWTQAPCGAEEQAEVPAAQPRMRAFSDGSTAQLDGELCEADIAALRLERPDGVVLRGRAALEGAQRLLLEERHGAAAPRQAPNARRAVAALDRDTLLLAVVGLPWREALAQLAAQGVVVTRDGLRSGQRAARRRCMGLAAHAARSPRGIAKGGGGRCELAPLQ